MKYSLFSINTNDIRRVNKKAIYNVGEVGCIETMINISFTNPDSLAVGFGPSRDEVHGIAGSFRQWKGVSQLWGLFGKEVDANKIELVRVCRKMIDFARREQELRRVSLTVRSGYTAGDRFAVALGMELEGRMRGFFEDGGDANLFARIL